MLKTFFQGFDVSVKFANVKRFEFLIVRDDEAYEKGCLALFEHLKEAYGNEYVSTLGRERFILDLSKKDQ